MIRLHHCPQSRSMRTLWLLHELGAEFELITHPFDRSLRDPDYLKVSPAGRVPSLEIDGTSMIETGAIAEYLCERLPDAGLGRLPGDPERRDWLVWIHFAETISQHAATLTQQHVVLYEDAMRSPILMKIEAARLKKCYAAVENRLAGSGPSAGHLLDTGFSAADVGVGQAIYMARHFAGLQEFPATAAWYERITSRPGYRDALPRPDEPGLYEQEFYPAWETGKDRRG